MFSSMPALDDTALLGEHHVTCEPGTVQVGNRCMPASALVGDDHQVGGHHVRSETGDYHILYNSEADAHREHLVFDDDSHDMDTFGAKEAAKKPA